MDPQDALEQLQQPTELYILNISQPILNPEASAKRSSNASDQERTPSALQADLEHYRELFSKLRFSYVEQVTKERFLRAVTAEQPEFVDADENRELGEKLAADKAALKARKEEVRGIIGDLEEQGRVLAKRYEEVELQTTQLAALPEAISHLESAIANLRASQEPKSANPSLNLPLQPTLSLLSQKEQELADLDRQIAALKRALPEKKRAVADLEADLGPLEARKNGAVQSANEAKRGRENGGLGDELEERGRWLKGVDRGLKTMLEV